MTWIIQQGILTPAVAFAGAAITPSYIKSYAAENRSYSAFLRQQRHNYTCKTPRLNNSPATELVVF